MIFLYGTVGIFLIVNGFLLPPYFMDFIINNYGYIIYDLYSSFSKGNFDDKYDNIPDYRKLLCDKLLMKIFSRLSLLL